LKMWSVMAQAIPGISNYSGYLPRMVLMINKILPKDMSTLLKHSLLFSPTGRTDHFQSKDGFLELQNYWLKHFYNWSGIGTRVEHLKDLFSMNIPHVSKQPNLTSQVPDPMSH
jgi:hypothetical protein